MKHDLEMIVHKLDRDLEYANIYPLGDLHIGSAQFDEQKWYEWKKTVLEDKNGFVVIVGDLMDNGLRTSKTSPYEATMRPWEQKEWLKRELGDLKEKILGACRGNHEFRTSDLSDGCPMYDVMSKLDLEDLYRENLAFIKVSVGSRRENQQYAYNIVLGHGVSKKKTEDFGCAIDGMDVFVTGHLHTAVSSFPAKFVIDSRNELVKQVDYVQITVPSFQKSGGYSLRGMYKPQGFKIPIVTLSGTKKGSTVSWT